MNQVNIRFLTRTAILLALTIVFQMLRPWLVPIFGPNQLFVIGTLVNASLLVAAGTVGIKGGVVISIIAPVVAFFQGHLAMWFMIPVVALGNAVIVIAFNLFKDRNKVLALSIAAVAKYLVLFFGVQLLLQVVAVPPKQAATLTFSFSWPQLVTAALGGVVALPVLRILEKNIRL